MARRALGWVLALALGGLAVPLQVPGQGAAWAQPAASPRPLARPAPEVPRGVVAGVTAGAQGIQRSPVPLRRPGGAPGVATDGAVAQALAEGPSPAQVPLSMIPVGTPEPPPTPPAMLADEVAPQFTVPPDMPLTESGLEIAVTAGAGLLRPAPRAAAISDAVAQALADAQAAAVIGPPPDPRAVARSLIPPDRTPAARRRFEAAVAQALARAEARRPAEPQVEVAAVAQPPRAAEPAGPGLCGMAGLSGRRLPRVTSSTRGCGIDEPVSLTAVHGIRLSSPATLHCDAARATGRWVRDVLEPAVGRTGGGVSEIRVAAHYACRTRNNQRGARISEHGRGRAIDISGFRLADGTQVSVLRDYRRGTYRAMLRAMRAGACGIFTTTLGPGSDRFHSDHFHFDVAQHRGGGTYCR